MVVVDTRHVYAPVQSLLTFPVRDTVARSDLWRCRVKLYWRETTPKTILGHVFGYEGILFSESTQISMSLPPPRLFPLIQALQKHARNKGEMEMAFSEVTSPQRITNTLGIDGAPFT